MHVTNIFVINGLPREPDVSYETTGPNAFEFMIGTKALAARWFSVQYDGNKLRVEVYYNDLHIADCYTYSPAGEREEQALAWMTLFIVNWQAIEKNSFEFLLRDRDVDGAAAEHAAQILGLRP